MMVATLLRPRDGSRPSGGGRQAGGRELLRRLRRSAPGLYAVLSARAAMTGRSLEEMEPEELLELAASVSPGLARILAEAA